MINAKAVVGAVFGIMFASTACAQGWSPQRNVEVIVPATAGGSLDTTGRTVTRIWGALKLLPVSSTISNRAGGGHAVAYNYLAQRPNDPHFLAVTSSTLLASHINGHIPQTYTDFTPLAVLLTEYIAFAVRADSPLKTGKDVIEALRKAPGSLSLAISSATGGTHHISFGLPLASASDQGQAGGVQFFRRGGDCPAWRTRRRGFRRHGECRAARCQRQIARHRGHLGQAHDGRAGGGADVA